MNTTFEALAPVVPILRTTTQKTLLHVGCGTAPRSRLPKCFQSPDWREIRLDIDPAVKPDIVAPLTALKVDTQSVHAVWSSHNLEHLNTHEVPKALEEIHRVLQPNGFVLITLPDLSQIASHISQGKLEKTLYQSPAGPITPLDMLFGHAKSIQRGNSYMAHRTGFTAERLQRSLIEAGFSEIRVSVGRHYDLWAIAIR